MAGLKAHILPTWGMVPAAEWDALVGDGSPFLEHAYLSALEDSGSAAPDTGWDPRPVLVRDADGRLVAGAPAWRKDHSFGEFVYDFGWANAAAQRGIPYYPKVVVGVPFTPVTGPRLLARDPAAWQVLFAALRELARSSAGLHVLFPVEQEAAQLVQMGLFPRIQHQYHWRNEGYARWEQFLERFASKDRNKLRRERREVRHLRIESRIGPSPREMDALYAFYASTVDKSPYGQRHLTADLYARLQRTWGHRLHVVLAWDGDVLVGGALNVVKGDALYGRWWGCLGEQPFLHFEVCYHRGIEWCIANGLRRFEPGHGGEHKYVRGFEPSITWSAHALAHGGLHRALADWSAREAEVVRAEVDALLAASRLRRGGRSADRPPGGEP